MLKINEDSTFLGLSTDNIKRIAILPTKTNRKISGGKKYYKIVWCKLSDIISLSYISNNQYVIRHIWFKHGYA